MRVRAYSFRIELCDDPKCGPHIIAEDRQDRDICEITVSREQTIGLIKELQRIVYAKVVEDD
jgi:hypothetical protein